VCNFLQGKLFAVELREFSESSKQGRQSAGYCQHTGSLFTLHVSFSVPASMTRRFRDCLGR